MDIESIAVTEADELMPEILVHFGNEAAQSIREFLKHINELRWSGYRAAKHACLIDADQEDIPLDDYVRIRGEAGDDEDKKLSELIRKISANLEIKG